MTLGQRDGSPLCAQDSHLATYFVWVSEEPHLTQRHSLGAAGAVKGAPTSQADEVGRARPSRDHRRGHNRSGC